MSTPRGANAEAGPFGMAMAFLAVFVLAALVALIVMAARAVIDIGGFCAEGGPYVIAQHCPKGTSVILAAGIPLLFLSGFLYALAKPKAWPSAIGWPLVVLFVGLGIVFIEGAFRDPEGFGWVPLFVGLLMLAIGIVPAVVTRGRSSDSSSPSLGARGEAGPLIAQAAAFVAGLGFGLVAWGWIG